MIGQERLDLGEGLDLDLELGSCSRLCLRFCLRLCLGLGLFLGQAYV